MKKSVIYSSLFFLTLLLQAGCSQDEPKKVVTSRDDVMQESDIRSGKLSSSGRLASSCGAFFNGSWPSGSGFYAYPDRVIDLSTSANGRKIVLYLEAHDVPNRFVLYDANGNYVDTSPWLGNSSTPGPWGMSLSASSSGTITFYKSTATYVLKVTTSTSTMNDYWSFSVSCF